MNTIQKQKFYNYIFSPLTLCEVVHRTIRLVIKIYDGMWRKILLWYDFSEKILLILVIQCHSIF